MLFFVRILLLIGCTGLISLFACKKKENNNSSTSSALEANNLTMDEYRTAATLDTYNFIDKSQNKFELVESVTLTYQVRPDQNQALMSDPSQLKTSMLDFIKLNDATIAGINSSGQMFDALTKNNFTEGEYDLALVFFKDETASENIMPWLITSNNIGVPEKIGQFV